MALPLLALMGIGGGILGGASYLFGKQNERKAEREYAGLEQQVANSPWAGTPEGDNLLAMAQEGMESANFMDWAEGTPNAEMSALQNQLGMYQLQRADRASSVKSQIAQQELEFMRTTGLAEEKQMRDDWRRDSAPFRTVQNAAFDVYDAIDIGDVNAQTTAIYKLADLLEMGVVTDAEGNRITNAGSLAAEFKNQAGLMLEGKMSPGALARLKRQVNSLLENNQDALARVKGGYDTRHNRMQERFPALKLHDPYTFGTMFGTGMVQQLTPQEQAIAGQAGPSSQKTDPAAAQAATLQQAQDRIRQLEQQLQAQQGQPGENMRNFGGVMVPRGEMP
jgi:hypothetical protein